MRRIDPLFALILIGGVIFAVVSWLAPPAPDDRHIVVDRQALIEFVQFRTRSFDPEKAAQILDAMDPAAYAQLRSDFIDEEILYREARSLQLDQSDYVIRLRMVQKLEFLNESLLSPANPSAEDLTQFYNDHQDVFTDAARISFVHMFRAGDGISLPPSLTPQNTAEFSDLFPHQLSYADRPRDLIEAHFGTAMTDRLFAPATPLDQWVGPLRSPHGLHFVMISARHPQRLIPQSELGARLLDAWRTEDRKRRVAALMTELRAAYKIDFQDKQ